MLQAIAYHEEVYVEQEIVGGNLVENFLGQGDVGSLVFDNHSGAKLTRVEHAVGAQCLVATLQLNLIG